MPLLNKKPFQKNAIPAGLKETDKVFHCDVTNEIFDDYHQFAERIILCNSLVWACEETGKSGLTYVEAVECEKNARKLLHDFPTELRRPILYLITLTNRSALNDLTEDLFAYVRERYFVGEIVEFNHQTDQWARCRILQVVSPSSKDLADVKNGLKPGDKQFWPPGSTYQYEVELLTKTENCSKSVMNTIGSNLRRKKSTYTKDRNHLFIKHYVYKVEGIWKLKPNVFKRYNIGKLKFEDIFAGSLPKFSRSDSPRKSSKKSISHNSTPIRSPNKTSNSASKFKKQESIDKYLKPKLLDCDGKSPAKKSSSGKDIKKLNNNNNNKKSGEKRKNTEQVLEQEMMEKRKKMMEHQQQLFEKKQKKQLDTQRKRDEKKRLEEFLKEWSKTREDLELEDLRDLPHTTPIHLNTPNEYFGQIIMIYEFFQSFFEQVSVKNFFPAGVTIDLIDRAISQKELAGPLSDFVHLLLSAIFKLQEDEEDDIGEPYDSFAVSNFEQPSSIIEKPDSLNANVIVAEAAINWPLAFHGVPLPKLGVDATTISEVLRLHLLSAGSRVTEACSRWRAQEKCGFTPNDDPAIIFRQENAHIIRLLSEKSVAALTPIDKIAILECLVNQVVMYAGVRNLISDSVDNNRLKRVEIRSALAAELKKEKEILQKKKDKKSDKTDGHGGADDKNSDESDPVTSEVVDKQMKDIERKKEELRKQLADLMTKNMTVQLTPLGLDRAYRRFWMFPTVPGIFVEDNELNPPPCLPRGTPAPNPNLMKEKDPTSYVKKLFQMEYNKENLSIFSAVSSPKKIYGELIAKEETSRNPLSCWGDFENCPVHSIKSSKIKWSYYKTEADVETLLNTLNIRGKRECKLRAMLMQHRETILQGLKCPSMNLNKLSLNDSTEESAVVEPRKSSRGNPTYEDTMFSYPVDMDVENVLEALLRNTITNIEERTNIGGLGTLKVYDRDLWVNAIKENSYIQSCDKLVWGPENEVCEEVERDSKSVNKERKYIHLEKFDVLNYARQVNPKVNDLARAILQLEQSVQLHYLKPPLGAERPRHPSKDVSKAVRTDLLKRWEASLMSSTSFAQLFLHTNTLENSIAWNRSAQNAYCRLCRRRGDAQNMLLCDSCNKGHHMYCLKPKLTKVPKGDWFCHYCKPSVKEPRERRERKPVNYAPDSDEDSYDKKNNIMSIEKMELKDKGKCKVCNEKGNTIGCSKCAKRYHLTCIVPPLRRVPTINWSCHSCRHISARKDEEAMYLMNGHRRRTRHSLESDYCRELPLDNATLQEMLEKIMKHEDSWPFIRPVSRSEAPDYAQIVKRPMDFGTIKHKLNMLEYRTNSQVISDSMLVFSNCFLYNKETADVYPAGVRLQEYFKELCHEMNLDKELLEVESTLSRANSDAIENIVVEENGHFDDEGSDVSDETDSEGSNDDELQRLVVEDVEDSGNESSGPPTKRARNS